MNFDRLAPHYDWLEALTAGDRLQRARTAWLEQLNGRSRILVVGEGHGRFVEACGRRFPAAEITVVEGSARMLARAQARTRELPVRFHWNHADVLTWEPAGHYDAIVTCFFLDCFPPGQLAQVLSRLAACAAPGARWLVTDFAVPGRGFARWRAQAVHALMYGFFRVVAGLPARRLTPPDDLLRAHGFTLAGRSESEWGLLRADVWQGS